MIDTIYIPDWVEHMLYSEQYGLRVNGEASSLLKMPRGVYKLVYERECNTIWINSSLNLFTEHNDTWRDPERGSRWNIYKVERTTPQGIKVDWVAAQYRQTS